jgi:hypothetical protein
MKRDDDGSQWQIQKPVHEGAGFPLAAQKDEELHRGLGLQDMRETKGSKQKDGKDFNRSVHPLLRIADDVERLRLGGSLATYATLDVACPRIHIFTTAKPNVGGR